MLRLADLFPPMRRVKAMSAWMSVRFATAMLLSLGSVPTLGVYFMELAEEPGWEIYGRTLLRFLQAWV